MTTTSLMRQICEPSQRTRPLRNARICKVRRQLFTPINHEETRKFLESELELSKHLASEAWNFDFDKGEPILDSDTKYEWKRISPSFAPQRPRRSYPEPDITHLYASVSPTPIVPELLFHESEEKHTEEQAKTSKAKQSKVTDFMPIRKRNSDSLSKKTTESVIPAKISKYNDVTS